MTRPAHTPPWPLPKEDLPPAPWEVGRPVTLPLDLLPEWIEHHHAQVLHVQVKRERGRLLLLAFVRPRETAS